ncbi:hypothetical protein ACFQ1L_15980 [Phytohabitans flavus]|uniref:hypothetical protein n=1 Tax=Phytohabitans flavus TaxID=1076124 RepID=UPI00362B47CA
MDVTVVGVARPLPGTGWDRDPLAGAGYDLAYQDGRSTVHAYGPFLVDLADLYASDSVLGRLEVTARPDLSHPERRDLDAVTRNVADADRRLERALADRVRIQRVESRLPLTLDHARQQQQVTAAAVLAVAVLGCVLAATALALAGRLTAGVRTAESTLLSALGVGRGQFAAAATVEGSALAVLAGAIAIPASSASHAGLTHLPPLSGAGLAVGPGVNGAQVLAVAAGAVALAAVLVVLAIRRAPDGGERHHRRELLARSGADLLLVALAAIGWWQMDAQPTGSGARADAVRVLAPALVLTAGAALALRVAPHALRGVDRLARKARGLAFPLAAIEAARRSHAMAAGLLIGLACAAGTFGIALNATWERSQRDQADLSVGTDLTLTLAAAPRRGRCGCHRGDRGHREPGRRPRHRRRAVDRQRGRTAAAGRGRHHPRRSPATRPAGRRPHLGRCRRRPRTTGPGGGRPRAGRCAARDHRYGDRRYAAGRDTQAAAAGRHRPAHRLQRGDDPP